MEIHELVVEMKLLERRLSLYEEKYGVLSEDFYAALIAGELERYDAYAEQIQQRDLVETLRIQPAY
jgi:hypothetical protein